jgi:hypothetical protein
MSPSQSMVSRPLGGGQGLALGTQLVPLSILPLSLPNLFHVLLHLVTPSVSPSESELRSQGPEPLPQQQLQSPDAKPKPNERGVSACGTPTAHPLQPSSALHLRSIPSICTLSPSPEPIPGGSRDHSHQGTCAKCLSGQDYISQEALL